MAEAEGGASAVRLSAAAPPPPGTSQRPHWALPVAARLTPARLQARGALALGGGSRANRSRGWQAPGPCRGVVIAPATACKRICSVPACCRPRPQTRTFLQACTAHGAFRARAGRNAAPGSRFLRSGAGGRRCPGSPTPPQRAAAACSGALHMHAAPPFSLSSAKPAVWPVHVVSTQQTVLPTGKAGAKAAAPWGGAARARCGWGAAPYDELSPTL